MTKSCENTPSEPLVQIETVQKTDEKAMNDWYSSPKEAREVYKPKHPNDADDRTVEVDM